MPKNCLFPNSHCAFCSFAPFNPILGKPKGTIQKSKFDKHAEKIKELLDYGLSVRKISSVLEYTNHIVLNTYINKRNLKKKLQTT